MREAVENTRALLASSSAERKRLYLVAYGNFEVTDRGEVAYRGMSLSDAVVAYNALGHLSGEPQ